MESMNIKGTTRNCATKIHFEDLKLRNLLIILVTWSIIVIIIDFGKVPNIKVKIRKKTQCTPVENVIFLKTHKTGSSTVANVMYRYAKSHNMKVALPECEHRFCFPQKFHQDFLYRHDKNDTYNMLFNHAVFHKENMLNILDQGRTKIVTILREPYSQFDSAAQYFDFRKNYRLNGSLPVLDELFNISDKDLEKFIRSQRYDGYGAYSLTKNPNAFDMGFDPWNETNRYVETVLKTIERDFSLVMITEYMLESLVLLKNELCWDLKDVAFFYHNARLKKDVNTNYIANATKRVLSWNKLDAAIYNYFNRTFWRKIENSDANFKQEVEKLREMNKLLLFQCSHSSNHTSVLKSDFGITESIPKLCSDLQSEELNYTIALKKAKDKMFLESTKKKNVF